MDVLLRQHTVCLPLPASSSALSRNIRSFSFPLPNTPSPAFLQFVASSTVAIDSFTVRYAVAMRLLTHSLGRPGCRHSVALPAGITTCSRSLPQTTSQLRRRQQQLPLHDLQSRRCFISLSSLFTSSSESTTKTHEVSDAEVYTLARQKQHPLSLADLIKYTLLPPALSPSRP